MPSAGRSDRLERARWAVVVVLAVLLTAYLVAVPLGIVEQRLTTTELLVATVLLAGVALLDKVTDFSVGAAGVAFKLRSLEQRQAHLETEVEDWRDRVTSLFLNAMAGTKRTNLEKVRDGGYYERTDDLLRELTSLRDEGYLGDFDPRAIPANGDRLSNYVPITAEGLEFLALRAALVNERARRSG